MAAYGFKEVFTRESFGDGEYYDFEEKKIRGPKDYDSVLSRIYGEYMKIPPVDERNKHHAEIVVNKGSDKEC